MAHPNPNRTGSEAGQRDHATPNTEFTDAGVQAKSQGIVGGKASLSDGQGMGSAPEAGSGQQGQQQGPQQSEPQSQADQTHAPGQTTKR